MNAQEKFDALPSHYTHMSVEGIVQNWLVGQYCRVNHPVTVLNPDDGFMIKEVKIELDENLPFGRISVRGENTCWFGQNSFKVDICPI